MKKLILMIIILGVFTSIARSQVSNDEFNGGSPYTIFGIGDLKLNNSVRTDGMSVLGIGLQGDYINTLNPAANTMLQYTRFSIGANYGYLESTNGVQTSKVNEGNITGINIGIPIDKENGWTLNMGINPMSEVNYKIINNRSTGGESYTNTYSGEGGLTRINIAMAYRFLKSLSIGAEYNYAFGNIASQRTTDFTNQNLFDNYLRTEIDMSKSFFKGGVVFALENLVNKKSKNLRYLTLGFFYQMPIELNANEESIIATSVYTDSSVVRSGVINLPAAYGFGIANRFGDRVNVAVDAYFQQFSEYTEFGVIPSNFTNSSRYGAGLELLPSPDRDRSFFERLTYRAGGFYEKAYYIVNSEEISTLGFSLGVGIPISDYNSLDLSFMYSMRGTEDNGLVKDNLFMVNAGFNFGELWFLQPNEDF
jgi:hypothetical protein